MINIMTIPEFKEVFKESLILDITNKRLTIAAANVLYQEIIKSPAFEFFSYTYSTTLVSEANYFTGIRFLTPNEDLVENAYKSQRFSGNNKGFTPWGTVTADGKSFEILFFQQTATNDSGGLIRTGYKDGWFIIKQVN